MSDLDLIPPYLHERVRGLDSAAYDGKLSALLEAGEVVEHATLGQIDTQYTPNHPGPARPALLAITDRRVLAVRPRRKTIFGTKDPPALISVFTPSDGGNVFRAGVLNYDSSQVIVEVAGAAPPGMPGRYVFWRLAVRDPDLGNLWAVVLNDAAEAGGGSRRRPNGL
jgi:hypothetical protein